MLEYHPNDRTRRIQTTFSRAARVYQQQARVQAQVSHQLMQWLPTPQRGWLLDLGAGPGVNSAALAPHCQHLVNLDMATGMVAQGQHAPCSGQYWVQADMTQTPFADATFDTLFSSLAVQWVADPAAMLTEWYRILKPGGCLLYSTLLTGTMEPLRQVQQDCGWPHPEPRFKSLHDWQQWHKAAGFHEQQVACQTLTRYGHTVRQLLHEVRAIGASGPTMGYRNKAQWQQLFDRYECYRKPSGLPLHYVVAWCHVKRPAV